MSLLILSDRDGDLSRILLRSAPSRLLSVAEAQLRCLAVRKTAAHAFFRRRSGSRSMLLPKAENRSFTNGVAALAARIPSVTTTPTAEIL